MLKSKLDRRVLDTVRPIAGSLLVAGALFCLGLMSVHAQLAGDPTNIEFGWQSLETNKTYYGSPNISTGNATTYTVCTGENPTCDTGETLLQDGSTYLFWRTPEMEASTFGGVGAE